MKNNVQIGFFYKDRSIFEPVKFANMIIDKIPEFGKPHIPPYNITPENEDTPVVVFQEFIELQLMVGFNNLLITVNEDAKVKKEDIIKNIFKVFDKFEIEITRMGYVINTFTSNIIELNAFKNNCFSNDEIKKSNEIQLSFHNIVEINDLKCNFWQRFVASKEFNGLITTFDVNTVLGEKHNVDKHFAFDFIENVTNYVKNN